MIWFAVVALLIHAADATIPTLICDCSYSCTLYQNISLTCGGSTNFTYTEKTPYTCLQSPEFCHLPSESEIGVVYQTYSGQPFVVSGNAPRLVNCSNASFTVFDHAAVDAAPLVQVGNTCVGTPDFTYMPTTAYTLAIYLNNFFNGANGTVTVTSGIPDPAFVPTFGLVGDAASFTLAPRSGCCTSAPASIEVGNACDVVEFLGGPPWIATVPFDVACATASRRLTNSTQYWFNVTLYGNTTDCATPLVSGYFNATQINPDTSSPTFTPTFDPALLTLVPIETALVEDVICPTTVSGFAKPFFATHAVTSLVPSFRTGSIWFPSSLFSVDSGGGDFNITSGACVPQDQSCVSYWSATAQVEAPYGSESVLANAAGSDAVQCVPRSQCYVGEAQNVNPTHTTQLTVSWPQNPNDYAIVDIISQVAPDEFVTFDTLRVTYYTLNGLLRYDVSAQYKANVMGTPTYPEYSNGLFCRFNDTLFFVPPRVNGWTATNLAALNSTLCAYVSNPAIDRIMFIPSGFVFGDSTFVTLVLEGFGQIRSNGTFVGCVYAQYAIAPVPSNVKPSNPVVLIYELVFGILGGLVVIGVLAEIERRRRRKRKPKPNSQ